LPDPVPLFARKPDQDPVEVPEVLFISALLDTGAFTPDAYGIDESKLAAYTPVYAFCLAHQQVAGASPDLDLVQRRHPDFPYVPRVNVSWAARELITAAYARAARRATSKGLQALNVGDVTGFADAIATVAQVPIGTTVFGRSSLAPENADHSAPRGGLPLPWATFERAVGGITPTDLVFIAARPGVGKTYSGTGIAAHLAARGYTVRYVSIEMSAWMINRRVNLHLAADDPGLQAMLRSADAGQRLEAIAELSQRTPGKVETIDPSDMAMTVSNLPQAAHGAHLLVVDHVGLLKNRKGMRATEDWRLMAEISNTLVEQKLAYKIPILGLVQVNRGGETKSLIAPKMSAMRQSQALEEDGDIVVTQARPNDGSVMVHQLRKNREGAVAKWYTRFQPEVMNFAEVPPEQAKAQIDIDTDAFADWQ